MKAIMHIDFNSYFATVEQQANPRLRGKPIGVTGGDRMKRTVLGAASIEAKKFGVKTGMQIWQARQLCPQIILVPGDSDKYLETTKRFINILKDYSPYLEVFSIDECFLELSQFVIPADAGIQLSNSANDYNGVTALADLDPVLRRDDNAITVAKTIKTRIKAEIGEWITCSIGISYNKLMAKLAGSLQKPDGLVIIPNEEEAIKVLDKLPLDEICGIGYRIKNRLNKIGIFTFKQLRAVPINILLFEFKSYGQFLYDAARGIDHTPITPFYEKEEVKSIGHRHTIDYDTDDQVEIKQIMFKLTELVARRLRIKKLVGKTVNFWFRNAFERAGVNVFHLEGGIASHQNFSGDGMQVTIQYTNDGLEIFKAAWNIFHQMWVGQKIRMVGVSISNLRFNLSQNISLLPDDHRTELINKTLDEVNEKFGEFTLQRGILLESVNIKRKPNSFLSDRRFKI